MNSKEPGGEDSLHCCPLENDGVVSSTPQLPIIHSLVQLARRCSSSSIHHIDLGDQTDDGGVISNIYDTVEAV